MTRTVLTASSHAARSAVRSALVDAGLKVVDAPRRVGDTYPVAVDHADGDLDRILELARTKDPAVEVSTT